MGLIVVIYSAASCERGAGPINRAWATDKENSMPASFLRLKPSAAQIQRALKNSSFEEMTRREALNGFNERPETAEKFFRSGTAGQWRRG